MEQELKLPRKSLFKVEELCGLTGVKPYVLRFWETEFSEISPLISASGQKFYEVKDIKVVSLIKKMLFEEKMTIQEAKNKLQERIRERMVRAQNIQISQNVANNEASEVQEIVTSKVEKVEPMANHEQILPLKGLLEEIVKLTREIRTNHSWI